MALTKTEDQGAPGWPGKPPVNKQLESPAWLAGQKAGASAAKNVNPSSGQTYTKQSGGIPQEGKPYFCPVGSILTYERNGSGNHVCEDPSTGRQFSVTYRDGGGGGGGKSNQQPPAGGSSGGGGGGTSGGGSTGSTNQGDWLQAGADLFAQNPEAMLSVLLEQQYGDNNSWNGLYDMLRPYGEAANVMFLAQRGQDAEAGTKDAFLSYLEDYWNTLKTPGARLDWQSALNNILNPSQNSPLASYLMLGDPTQQAANALRLVAGVTDTSFHPLIADAIMNRMGHEADRFIGKAAQGPVDPFIQYFQSALPYNRRLLPGT